jgi:hypothetical protein
MIWAFFGFIIRNYNSFSKDIELISNFYTTEDPDILQMLRKNSDDTINPKHDQKAMQESILAEMTSR